MKFIIRQLNINHRVIKESTENTENDIIRRLKNVTLLTLCNILAPL